ncbi:MAG: hypothetical protein SGARI_004807 [Bacillariaceae sp.]
MCFKTSFLLLCLSLSLKLEAPLVNVNAQDPVIDGEIDGVSSSSITACSVEGDAKCNQTLQYCWNSDELGEFCGHCVLGYMPYPLVNPYLTEMVDSKSDPNCTNIFEIDWDDYEEAFEPQYHDESTTTVDEHLKSLQASMLFISGWYSNLENQGIDVGLTKFSADTIEDAKNRLGYIPDETQSDTLPRLEVPTIARNSGRKLQQTAAVPPKVNHAETGAVGPVQNQGTNVLIYCA